MTAALTLSLRDQAEELLPDDFTFPDSDSDTKPGERSRARVEAVMDLMLAGQFVTGSTCDVIADRSGLHLKTIQGYASQASLFLEMLGDVSAITQRLIVKLERIVSRTDAPDASVIAAARLILDAVHRGNFAGEEKSNETEAETIAGLKKFLQNPNSIMLRALNECGWQRIETEGVEL